MTLSLRRASLGLAMALAVVACGSPTPTSSDTPTASVAASPSPAATSSVLATTTPTAQPSTSVISGPIAARGSIAVLNADAALSIVDVNGTSTLVAGDATETYGFPTWSPDGMKVATVRTKGSDVAVVVIDASDIAAGLPVRPKVLFDKSGATPFYLFWAPDASRLSFLASEGGNLQLRVAAADGSSPVDGSGPKTVVRTGNPFYYDWLASDRLLAHIGTGADGFLGQIGLDGKAGKPLTTDPADFRPPVVSGDRTSIAYVRATGGIANDVVVTAPDGSHVTTSKVLGPSAIGFDPKGDTLATLGAEDVSTLTAFPLGPLKLMDRAGKVRTLLDGLVASFWWSPDGKTIAAIRVIRIGPAGSATPSGQSPEPTTAEVHLVFVDVASGRIVSDPIIQPGPSYVNALFDYFDQYALSHRLWAPDSASFLMPEVDDVGVAFLAVRYADGRPMVRLDGSIGFWSP